MAKKKSANLTHHLAWHPFAYLATFLPMRLGPLLVCADGREVAAIRGFRFVAACLLLKAGVGCKARQNKLTWRLVECVHHSGQWNLSGGNEAAGSWGRYPWLGDVPVFLTL